MRIYESAAASSASVCSDEYTVGNFSSNLGTGGKIAFSIPANRNHNASLVCLLATVRSTHVRFRRAEWKLKMSSRSISSTYALFFIFIRAINSAVTFLAWEAASNAFRPSASAMWEAAVFFRVFRLGLGVACTSVSLAASITTDVPSNRKRRTSASAQHKTFAVDTDVKVYFCDPHSPWRRGTNENTNRLLRQYLPKKTDLWIFTQSHLDKIALRLNQRPRKTLEFQLPASKLQAIVASTF